MPIEVFTMADRRVHDRPIEPFTITDLAVHDRPKRASNRGRVWRRTSALRSASAAALAGS
jgi:hypothetical protein